MMTESKKMSKPFLWLFALSLVLALVARLGLTIAGNTGILAFDYISATDVPILDIICSILTGSAFVAFMIAAGLALVTSTAGCVLYGALYAKGDTKAKMSSAFLWGWATALVAIVSLLIVVMGILSAIQVGSMSSKMPGIPVIVLGVVVFAAFLGTLLGAASLTVCACIASARGKGKTPGARLLVGCIIGSLVVMVLTLGTFAALNVATIEPARVGLWFAADIVVNVLMMIVAQRMANRA